jgi:hypothetical protein
VDQGTDEQSDGPKSRIAPCLIDDFLAATSVLAAVLHNKKFPHESST